MAIRSGEWKLIPKESRSDGGKDELYDLKNDPSEKLNIADSNPEIVKNLLDRLTLIKDNQGVR
jgi:arylsulfatase A-like enzyme